MKKRMIWTTALLLAALSAAGLEGQWRGRSRPRNVILVGWDGVQRNHLKEALGRGELPHLDRLAAEGALVAIDILRTTDTKSGWTQILTGLEPETTGIFSNRDLRPIPPGLTIFERLEKHFGADNIATAALIGKGEADLGDDPGSSYANAAPVMDAFMNGLGPNDAVGTAALQYLEVFRNRPFFFFVHFADVDQMGHYFGENSREYNNALLSCDAWLGNLVRSLKNMDIYRDTLIYVTSDHGFDEGQRNHLDAPYIFLATNDPRVARRGGREDIAPTILDRLGVDLGTLTPRLQGHPLTWPYTPPRW
jgi:hypothetical protein